MKKEVKLQGSLKAYLCWPIYMTLLLILMNISIYVIDYTAGIVMTGIGTLILFATVTKSDIDGGSAE